MVSWRSCGFCYFHYFFELLFMVWQIKDDDDDVFKSFSSLHGVTHFLMFFRNAITSQPLIHIVSSLTSLMLQIKVSWVHMKSKSLVTEYIFSGKNTVLDFACIHVLCSCLWPHFYKDILWLGLLLTCFIFNTVVHVIWPGYFLTLDSPLGFVFICSP